MEAFVSLPPLLQLALGYLFAVNVIAFAAFGLDKAKSERGARRISEKTLWLLSFIGGSAGALLGMHLFRHKTKKISFQAGIIVIIAVQICVAVLLLSRTSV